MEDVKDGPVEGLGVKWQRVCAYGVNGFRFHSSLQCCFFILCNFGRLNVGRWGSRRIVNAEFLMTRIAACRSRGEWELRISSRYIG